MAGISSSFSCLVVVFWLGYSSLLIFSIQGQASAAALDREMNSEDRGHQRKKHRRRLTRPSKRPSSSTLFPSLQSLVLCEHCRAVSHGGSEDQAESGGGSSKHGEENDKVNERGGDAGIELRVPLSPLRDEPGKEVSGGQLSVGQESSSMTKEDSFFFHLVNQFIDCNQDSRFVRGLVTHQQRKG